METNMTKEEAYIVQVKSWRVALDSTLQEMKAVQEGKPEKGGRQLSISITDLESSIMRLGMVLKDLNTENPYPNSYNPENVIIEPTADGLKL